MKLGVERLDLELDDKGDLVGLVVLACGSRGSSARCRLATFETDAQ
jgi:hypothetical protein